MRRLLTIALALFLVLGFSFQADAAFKNMWAKVYKLECTTFGDPVLTEITTNVETLVLMKDENHEETLYYYNDPALTALTNPIGQGAFESNTKMRKGAGTLAFQVDPSESSDEDVDLIVTHLDGGYTTFVEDFDENVHKIVIDERPNIMHHGMIQWFDNTANAQVDTGIDFDYDSIIHSVVLEVITGMSAGTASIGLLSTEASGDLDGFIKDIYANGASVYLDVEKPTVTAGANETYIGAVSSVGALMGSSHVGSNVSRDVGSSRHWNHIINNTKAKSLVYSTKSGADTAIGLIHYFFTRLR